MIADDVEFAEGASVVLTVARAGFGSALTLRTNAASTTISLPQGGPSRAGDPRIIQLWHTSVGWTAVHVAFDIESPLISGSAPRTAVFSNESLPPVACSRARVVSNGEAAALCRPPSTCDLILVGGPRKFAEAIDLLAAVAPSQPFVGVSFLVAAPCDPMPIEPKN